MKFIITKKFYSKKDGLFHVCKKQAGSYFAEEIDTTYDNFNDFYNAINHKLEDADLINYDFNDCDPKDFDLSNALISSKVMLNLGIYNQEAFNEIHKDAYLARISPSTSLDIVPTRPLFPNDYLENDDNLMIFYISDLHLNHKLINEFKETANEFEVNAYLNNIIQSLSNSIPNSNCLKKILFVGDVSYNFEILKWFFNLYKHEIINETFFILGNHELWDKNLNDKCNSIEEIEEEYRRFFNSVGITLLENQIYFPNDKQEPHNKCQILSENEILRLSNEELRHIFTYNGYAIFGGLGYAGLNKEFNYNQGIYQNAQINREEEIERSKRIENIHKKLKAAVPDKKIFFVTHMPKSDWSTDDYVPNWVYISGHTHKNYFCEDEKKQIYADNQVGYNNKSFNFKFITSTYNFNIFSDYNDGIYEITREQYRLFYYGIGSRIDFNRKFTKLYMLKRNGIYCFLIQIEPNREFKLLNGGMIKNVGKHDLNYFYENLANYAASIKNFLNSYENFQKKVSNEVKKIGGNGRIHGCIIDIDFYNHLYLNPLDNKITAYKAFSMVEKIVYSNFASLLKENRIDLYNNLKSLMYNNLENKNAPTLFNNNEIENSKKVLVEDTEMYRISRIIKGLQYTTRYNVVRLWNDAIINKHTAESGKLIVGGIINPQETTILKREQRKRQK